MYVYYEFKETMPKGNFHFYKQFCWKTVSRKFPCGAAETNPISIHEVAGSIPGLGNFHILLEQPKTKNKKHKQTQNKTKTQDTKDGFQPPWAEIYCLVSPLS